MKIWHGLAIAGAVVAVGALIALNVDGNRTAKATATTPTVKADTVTAKPANNGRNKHPKKPYVVIDRYCNRLYLRTGDSILLEAQCSTGSGAELTDSASGRQWQFATPSGVFVVHSKLENPWWRKPDWAFIEEGEPIPGSDADRLDPEMLGEYALGFGDGYFIHGTIYERLLGVSVTHGCVRLGADDLRKLYRQVGIGTLVYVY